MKSKIKSKNKTLNPVSTNINTTSYHVQHTKLKEKEVLGFKREKRSIPLKQEKQKQRI